MSDLTFYEKIVDIQVRLDVPKGQRNTFGNYNYRSCEDILMAIKPLLKEHKLFLTLSDHVELVGDRYYIVATARISDGIKTVENTARAREELSKKGMDSAQLTGSTSSYGRKYALSGLFGIDDEKDSDATNKHDKSPSNNKNDDHVLMTGKQKGVKVSSLPDNDLKAFLNWIDGEDQKKAVTGTLEKDFNALKAEYKKRGLK
jgi:hypothetical protein